MNDEPATAKVIPFPRQFRVVPDALPRPDSPSPVVVDHDGRSYCLADLLGQLTPAEWSAIEATVPITAQAAWGEALSLAGADGGNRRRVPACPVKRRKLHDNLG